MELFLAPTDIRKVVLGQVVGGELQQIEIVPAPPELLLPALSGYLKRHGETLSSIEALFVVRGPGSASALRSGLAHAATLRFVLDIPLFLVEGGDVPAWREAIRARTPTPLHGFLTPLYERLPNITQKGM